VSRPDLRRGGGLGPLGPREIRAYK